MRAPVIPTLVAIVLLLSISIHLAGGARADTKDDELARLSAELNATRAENARLSSELNSTKAALEEAREDRDAYAERLESSTIILVMALVLISLATLFFWLTARRQAAVMRNNRREEQAAARPPRRRG